MNILPVAYNTFKEAIRDKILYVILLFSFVMISSSIILSFLSLGQGDKVIIDIGLGIISIFGVLITLFIGTNLLNKEIDKKTIYLLLTKPLRRSEFIMGKHLGLSFTIFIIVLLMTMAFYTVIWFFTGNLSVIFLQAILLNYIELILLIALAIFFSTIASPIMSSIYTLAVYVVGHFSRDLLEFGRVSNNQSFSQVMEIVYYFLPDLEKLNVKNLVIYSQHGLSNDLIMGGVIYGLLYTTIVLSLAIFMFEFKEF